MRESAEYYMQCAAIVDYLFPENEPVFKMTPDLPIRQWGLGWPDMYANEIV